MQQFLWRTFQATGVPDAAKAATESLVSAAARQLTEAATAEFERRWVNAATGVDSRSRKSRRVGDRPSRRGAGSRGSTGRRPAFPPSGSHAGAVRDEESLRRLRAAIAALDDKIDSLSATRASPR